MSGPGFAPIPPEPAPPAAPDAPGVGHNSGALDLVNVLDADLLNYQLRREYGDRLTRKANLLENFRDFEQKTAQGIETVEQQGRAGDIYKQLRDEADEVNTARETVKRPVLAAQRAIDGFFNGEIINPLRAAQDGVKRRMDDFAARQLAAERKRQAEAAAERQRLAEQEAAALAAQAAAEQTPAAIGAAIEAEQKAIDAAWMPPPPVRRGATKVTSDIGTTVSARTKRIWRVTDLAVLVKAVADGKAPLNLLTINEPIAAAMAKDPLTTDLPGLIFTDAVTAGVR